MQMQPRARMMQLLAGPRPVAGLQLLLAAVLAQVGHAAFPWLPGFAPQGTASPKPQSAAPPGPQPNPPTWPESVRVFGPQDDPGQITAAVNQAFATNGGHIPIDHGQFSSSRYAFLFRPGVYHVDVPVGYYTQVLGLGASPGDVVFDGPRGVHCEEGDQTDMGGSLSTFWRGAENFHHAGPDGMLWAVSQAAPVRRVMVDKDLNLAQFVAGVGMGYASGGFLANVQVGGSINSASQQQWCARNAGIGRTWAGAVWNMVFVGVKGAPPSHCGRTGGSPQVSAPATPVISEKPFITIDAAGKYTLQVPPVQRSRVGPDFALGRSVPFEKVFVAKSTDSAAEINRHLAAGMDLVLSPGVYHLEAPLAVEHDNQVVLGLGLATLVPDKGTAAIRVGNVDGVHIAGVLLQAGTGDTDALLQWGDGRHPGNSANPGFLHDVFARVGGPNDPEDYQVRAKVMVRIASGHVVGDNLWLWRADHGVAGIVKGSMNPCDHGLVVTGSHVTMYGLAAEHTLKDIVQWAGDHGSTYFFQSEMPYDVTPAYGDAGYVGYRVNDSVAVHKAMGVGVYHYFRDFPVVVKRGIAAPAWLENSFESPLSVSLTGRGTMLHVLNEQGPPTHGNAGVQWLCEKGPVVAANPTKTLPPRITTAQPTAVPPPPTTPSAVTQAPALPASTQAPTPPSTQPTQTAAPVPASTAAPTKPPGVQGQVGCAQAMGKCGGTSWDGPTCCADGFVCKEMGIWYSQCLPEHVKYLMPNHQVVATPAPAAPAPPPATAAPATTTRPTTTPTRGVATCALNWGKCGGHGWTGPTCCLPGSSCVRQSDWMSECIPGKKAETASTDTVYFKKDEVVPGLRLGEQPASSSTSSSSGVTSVLRWALLLVPLQFALVAFTWRLRRRRTDASPSSATGSSPSSLRSAASPLQRLQLPTGSQGHDRRCATPSRTVTTPGSNIRFRELAVSTPPSIRPRETSRNSVFSVASP